LDWIGLAWKKVIVMSEQTKNILHILRAIPDEGTRKMMTELSADGTADVIKLYDNGIDWDDVVDAIFSHNRVVCW
jgi:hypothetical protein